MTITNEQIKLLESYRDKSYITSILCSQSAEHFSFLRSIVNIPLILSSSTMTVLNSMDEGGNNNMKFANIYFFICISNNIIFFSGLSDL